jgi:hypothetical protein
MKPGPKAHPNPTAHVNRHIRIKVVANAKPFLRMLALRTMEKGKRTRRTSKQKRTSKTRRMRRERMTGLFPLQKLHQRLPPQASRMR